MFARLKINELKRLKSTHEFSSAELSQHSGVPFSTLDKLFSFTGEERIIIWKNVQKLAAVFKVDPDSLIIGEPWKKESNMAMTHVPIPVMWDPLVIQRAMKFRGITAEQIAEQLGKSLHHVRSELKKTSFSSAAFVRQVNNFLGLSMDHVTIQYPEGSRLIRDWKNRLFVTVNDFHTANGLIFHAGFPLDDDGYPLLRVNTLTSWVFPAPVIDFIRSRWMSVNTSIEFQQATDFLNVSNQATRTLFKELGLVAIRDNQSVQKILELHRQGLTPSEITNKLQYTSNTVRRTLIRHGYHTLHAHKWWTRRDDIMKTALNPTVTSTAFAAMTGYTKNAAGRLRNRIRRFYNQGTNRADIAQERFRHERAARGLTAHEEYVNDIDKQTFVVTERRKGDPDILKGRPWSVVYRPTSMQYILTEDLACFLQLMREKSMKDMIQMTGMSHNSIRPMLVRLGIANPRRTKIQSKNSWPPVNRELIQDVDGITFAVTRTDTNGPSPVHFGYGKNRGTPTPILNSILADWMREHACQYKGALAPKEAGFSMSFTAWARFRRRLGLTNQNMGRHLHEIQERVAEKILPWFIVDGIPDRIVAKAIPIARRIEQEGLSKDKLNKNERLYPDYKGTGHKLISVKLNRAYRLVIGYDNNGKHRTYGIMHHDDYEQRDAMNTFIQRAQA